MNEVWLPLLLLLPGSCLIPLQLAVPPALVIGSMFYYKSICFSIMTVRHDSGKFVENLFEIGKYLEAVSSSSSQTTNFFFYLGFLSRPFTIHRTAGEVEGYFFNSSLSLSMAFHRHLHISRTITAERSLLLINKNWAPLSQAS